MQKSIGEKELVQENQVLRSVNVGAGSEIVPEKPIDLFRINWMRSNMVPGTD
jgi:hypothetical protein